MDLSAQATQLKYALQLSCMEPAQSHDRKNSPPSCGLLLVPLLSSSSGPASGEICSAHRTSEGRACRMACFHVVAGLPRECHGN
eukprot:3882663-Pyramimonas_sp.AAC.1